MHFVLGLQTNLTIVASIKVIHEGSIDGRNWKKFLIQSDVDSCHAGRASLNPEFVEFVCVLIKVVVSIN